eukprot:15485405-Alexandrium_andersonii.AAC.1
MAGQTVVVCGPLLRWGRHGCRYGGDVCCADQGRQGLDVARAFREFQTSRKRLGVPVLVGSVV